MKRRRNIIGKLVRSGSLEAEQMDRAFWHSANAETKFAAAWEMVSEVSAIKGGDEIMPLMHRSVARLLRLVQPDAQATTRSIYITKK
jgi:hypothetical protein